MSSQIDINTLGDLIAIHGTEGDHRAWARLRAEIDRQRELIRMSDSEQCRRLQAELDAARVGLDAERIKWQGHPCRRPGHSGDAGRGHEDAV